MKAKLLKNYDVNTNDFKYKKDEIVDVTELESFKKSYAIYHNLESCNILDWIPKNHVELI